VQRWYRSIALTKVRARGETSTSAGSLERFVKVVLEFFIGEFSCLITAPDQVVTRFGLGVESVEECAQAPTDPVANDRVADLSTDGVRHGDRVDVRGSSNVADSK
jgi:hypothetical protein